MDHLINIKSPLWIAKITMIKKKSGLSGRDV
jgi:hypothetical protein